MSNIKLITPRRYYPSCKGSLSSACSVNSWSLLSISLIKKKLIVCIIQSSSINLTRSRPLWVFKFGYLILFLPMIKIRYFLAVVIHLWWANFALPRWGKFSPFPWDLKLLFNILTELLYLKLHFFLNFSWELKWLFLFFIRQHF